jgi:hypothetical protein
MDHAYAAAYGGEKADAGVNKYIVCFPVVVNPGIEGVVEIEALDNAEDALLFEDAFQVRCRD